MALPCRLKPCACCGGSSAHLHRTSFACTLAEWPPKKGLHRHVHAVHQRPPCGRSCGRRPKVEHVQSPGHLRQHAPGAPTLGAQALIPRNKASSVVAALIILVSNIGGHELCFIQRLANTTAIILTEIPC